MVWSRVSKPARNAAQRGSSGRTILAVARGGYVAGQSVRFQVAPDRRSVRTFVARVKCDRRLVVHGVRLHGGRRFGYRGRVPAGKGHAVRVQIVGRFLNTHRVRGFVRARSAGCDSGKVRFIARLS
jgi:hypothetical protein